jgi:hypothetical protein
MTLRLFSTIPVLVALASGCSPSFEADVPEIDITQRGVKIAGVPGAALVGDTSVTTSFTYSLSAGAKRMNSDVRVHRITIAVSGSVPNLDFVALARVTAANPASPESTTELLNYARSETAPSSSDIDASMATPIDITPLWSADKAVIELQMAGQLPEQDWTVDVTLSLSGKITYNS